MPANKLFRIVLIFSLLTLKAQEGSFVGCRAIIKDAVVDMSVSFPAPENSPASPESRHCHRAHQGLYNEIVDCLEEREESVKISIKNIVYGFHFFGLMPLSTFWVNKKHLIRLEDIMNTGAFNAVPNQKSTIVVTYPWNNVSVGTRLVRCPELDTEDCYAVTIADYLAKTSSVMYVPRINAICDQVRAPQESRQLFIKLLNQLIDRTKDHVIPYVWGGSSFINAHEANDFFQRDGAWERAQENCYTGYDCSELIMRMAQIAGLSFPWKTTTVIGDRCRGITGTDSLEEGDLIWIPGHVMIVSSLKSGEIIEARGYGSGYGCVHRLALRDCFTDIHNFQDLIDAHYQGKSLMLMNKHGEEKGFRFKILKLI